MMATEISDLTSSQLAAALERVHGMMLKMGGAVEERVEAVVEALDTRDPEAARKVAGSDYQINAQETIIDEKCANILALRQPVARDLRMVIAVLKIITDLERIGDEAQKIAKQILEMGQSDLPVDLKHQLSTIGKHTSQMLRKALDSFARTQTGAHDTLAAWDREVDSTYKAAINAFTVAVAERPADVKPLLNALWCARSLERIGDHAKNIGEYVVYLVEGEDIRHPGKKPTKANPPPTGSTDNGAAALRTRDGDDSNGGTQQ